MKKGATTLEFVTSFIEKLLHVDGDIGILIQ